MGNWKARSCTCRYKKSRGKFDRTPICITHLEESMTSVLIGASKVEQIEDAVGILQRLDFSNNELQQMEKN